MSVYLNVVDTLEKSLLEDINVNTCTEGNIDDLDLAKKTIYPLSHYIVTQVENQEYVSIFTIDLRCLDILDINKEMTGDNEKFIFNTQLEVINKLFARLRNGELFSEEYQLVGNPTIEPVSDSYDNGLSGWAVIFNIQVSNDICYN
jgi:hypothetical protein